MLIFILNVIFFLCKICSTYNDFHYIKENNFIYPKLKKNMILKSKYCQYFKNLPICSETILYEINKNKNPYYNIPLSSKVLHSIPISLNNKIFYNSWNTYKKMKRRRKSASRKSRRNNNFWRNNYLNAHKFLEMTKKRFHKLSNDEEDGVYSSIPINVTTDLVQKCEDFLFEINENMELLFNNNSLAQWNYDTNITELNKHIAMKSDEYFFKELRIYHKNTKNFNRENHCTAINGSVSRQFKLLFQIGEIALPLKKYLELQDILRDMESIYSRATVPSFDNKNEILTLEGITKRMAESRNEKELKYIWEQWRIQTGNKIKEFYPKYVVLMNDAAKLNDYKNAAQLWLSVYDDDCIEEKVTKIWHDVRPLYLQLHAYVRYKLRITYGDIVDLDSPIPAHLLGNIFGQTWINVYNITAPFPINNPDLTTELQKKNYTVRKMFEEAEMFFKSIGLSGMTQEFWKNSIMEAQKNVDMICHASAWDMYDRKDFSLLHERNESEGWKILSLGSLALGNLGAMECFSGADHALCVREFYKNGDSATVARRRFCGIRGFRHLNDAPSIPLSSYSKMGQKVRRDRNNTGKTKIRTTKVIKNGRKRGSINQPSLCLPTEPS